MKPSRNLTLDIHEVLEGHRQVAVGIEVVDDPLRGVALVAAENADSLSGALTAAHLAYRGTPLNLQADSPQPYAYNNGTSGVSGHEVCFSPPEGVQFKYDPHCITKFNRDPAYFPPILPPWPPGFARFFSKPLASTP